MKKPGIVIRRIYDPASPEDGYRILVDRLWPRGISKTEAALDEWNREVAPSPELRKWFGHKAERFETFAQRYRAELEEAQAALQRIRALAREQRVTLLYGAKDPQVNHAVVLLEALNALPER